MLTKWLQFRLTKTIVVMVMLIFSSDLVVGCGPASPEPTSTSASFSYLVRVQAKDTSEPIPKAEVRIEVGGKAPLDEITDAGGYARIFVDSFYVGQPGKLIIKATGYEGCEKNIDLTEGALPEAIQLQKSEAASLGPTPVMLPSGTITPTILIATPNPVPTSVPIPANTTKTVDIPTQSYPKPILVSPASGTTITGEKLTTFSWQWDGTLQEGEKFDLRIWRGEKTPRTIVMPDKPSHLLDTPPDEFGDYLWQVAVIQIDESGGKSTLCESLIWPFVWSESDAVVKTEALNLRSGPGVVYDILEVLKLGDCLKITGRNPACDWLKVFCPDRGKRGWVAASYLQANKSLTAVPVVQAPPTPTPTHTPAPAVTPTPTLLPPPIPLEPGNGAAFLGEPADLKWQWDYRPRATDEVFSVRVRREGEERPCHHDKADKPEYKASLSYCTAGTHYWSVALVRDLDPSLPEEDLDRWQDLSTPSAERWFYYVPPVEPWTWPALDKPGPEPSKEPPKEPPG